MEFSHVSVLLHETVDGAFTAPKGVYADLTTGGGGHSLELAMRLDGGRLIYLIWEAKTHIPVHPEKEGMVHFIGLVFFMVLMVFLLFNDLVNIFG